MTRSVTCIINLRSFIRNCSSSCTERFTLPTNKKHWWSIRKLGILNAIEGDVVDDKMLDRLLTMSCISLEHLPDVDKIRKEIHEDINIILNCTRIIKKKVSGILK